MAINFPAKLQLLGSVHDRELFKPKVPNRKEARKSSAAIAFQSINERTRVVGSKLFEFGANYEYSQKAQVQELVDQLHSCAEKGLLTETKVIHGYLLKSDFDDDNLLKLLNHVIYAYLKCSDFESAKIVFNYLPRTNVFSWSVMIAGFNQQASFRDGLNYFCKMTTHGILPDGFTYSAILQSCIGMGSVDLGDVVHGQIIFVHGGLLSKFPIKVKGRNPYDPMQKLGSCHGESWPKYLEDIDKLWFDRTQTYQITGNEYNTV
ncbi:Pentatricopeptide repeat-containing protein, chloroplastic [Sesamum alatum]|uniref:Pentatricopeptide repeat-containing protein, chloroplastic n=1 Tax=Sesamum alatum TaxID=300844 RepID=A0AAE2CTB8_9LAMI|nr:Pentatricopeptide repeat-containing protein, chloroplastic [Sesamum alatum]